MKDAVSIGIEELPFIHSLPEIIKIEYDIITLSIDAFFYQLNDETVNLKFENIVGFRVLDEGNILEFWNKKRPQGWVWEVLENGWFDLEKTRGGFVLGYIDDNRPKEYIVLGVNDCVSVLTYSSPIISEVKNKDESR